MVRTLSNSWWKQVKQLDKWFDYGFYLEPEQKKQILNSLLESFILYRDGRIELRFKLPVNGKQVAEVAQAVVTLSQHKLV